MWKQSWKNVNWFELSVAFNMEKFCLEQLIWILITIELTNKYRK